MNNLTLILLVKGRDQFTKRWLNYMSSLNYKYKIVIGDGNKKSNIKKILKSKKYQNLNIKYVSYNNTNYKDYYYMMYDIVKKHINTKYIRFCDNDDFVLPKQQENLIKFYEKNQKYISVGDFQIRFELIGKNNLYGNKLYFWFEGINRKIEKFSTKDISEIFLNYQGYLYNIFKKKNITKILFEIYKLNFSDLEIRDFYFKLRLITLGNLIYLNQSSYIRQHGTSQISSDFLYSENFIKKDIKNDVKKMAYKISNICNKKFNKNKKLISNLIVNSYKDYLNITIAHNKRKFLYPKYFNFKNYIYKNFKNIFFIIRKIQNFKYFLDLKKLYKNKHKTFDKELFYLKNFLKN